MVKVEFCWKEMICVLSDFNESIPPAEWGVLEGLGLTLFIDDEPKSTGYIKLLDDYHCLKILDEITPEIGSPSLKVTASLVMKRMAFLTLAPTLFSMSRYNIGLDASLSNCIFEYPLEKRIWRSRMPLKVCRVRLCDGNRSSWRKAILTRLFAGNLSLLVEQFHRVARVPKTILWENIAVRVFSIYEKKVLLTDNHNLIMQAKEDYAYLLGPEEGYLFGLSYNPLTTFHGAGMIMENEHSKSRIRKTCCYYYQATDPRAYCDNCPLLVKKRRFKGSKAPTVGLDN